MLYAGCYMKRKSPEKNAALAIPKQGGLFPATNLSSAPLCNRSLNILPGVLRGLPLLFIHGPELACMRNPGEKYGIKL